MTIRAIIKTSNLVQLGLVLLLGVCFFGLGRELREVNGLLRNFYRIDALFSELQANADDKYRLALDYVSAPSARGLKDWQNLILAERGIVARPPTSFLAGDERSLQRIADSLDLHTEGRELLQFLPGPERIAEPADRSGRHAGARPVSRRAGRIYR